MKEFAGHIFQEEVNALEAIANQGFNALDAGDIKKAKCCAKKLKKTHFVSEGEYFRTLLLAAVHLQEGKIEKAQELVRANIGYCWGDEEAFAVLGITNPQATDVTKCYIVKAKGGIAIMGIFNQMSDKHYAIYQVLADTEEQAYRYIRELGVFHKPEKIKMKTLSVDDAPVAEGTIEGVLSASSFAR